MPFIRTILLLAVLIAPIAAADDDYYRQQQQQDLYRQQQQQELYRQQQQQELYRQQQQQQALQQQELARRQEQQRFERDNLERQRVEQARLDQARERETFRRRQERDEDERRDENRAIQQRERDEAFERMEALRRRQNEWTRQALPTRPMPPPAVGTPAGPKSCRTVHFKTVGTLDNFSDPKSRQVTTEAALVSEAGDGFVGFTVRDDNEGHMITRFEAAPTSKNVDLIYGEKCQIKGTLAACVRFYRAMRGSLEFEVLTTVSAPRGRLIAHVKGAALVQWDLERRQAVSGGDCVTFEVFNYEATFLPK